MLRPACKDLLIISDAIEGMVMVCVDGSTLPLSLLLNHSVYSHSIPIAARSLLILVVEDLWPALC